MSEINETEDTQEVVEPEQTVEETQEAAETTDAGTGEGVETPSEETSLSVEDIAAGTKKVKTSIQQRIDELTREKYDLRRKVEHLKEQVTQRKIESPAIPQERPLPPLPDDFIGEPDKYRVAFAEYEDKVDVWRSRHRQNEAEQTRFRQEYEAKTTEFNAKSERVRQKYADFDNIIDNSAVISPTMAIEIMESDFGPEIAYFLGKNPVEALKMVKLSPRQVAKEIGKLEMQFSQAVKKVVTSAPEPVHPVKGQDIVQKDPQKMTDSEWFEWDKQQKIKKLKLA